MVVSTRCQERCVLIMCKNDFNGIVLRNNVYLPKRFWPRHNMQRGQNYVNVFCGLYKMLDEVGTVAWEHVDDGNLDHRVASGLETLGGTGNVDEHLSGEGGVVDAHVELQALVLSLAAHALAH